MTKVALLISASVILAMMIVKILAGAVSVARAVAEARMLPTLLISVW